MATHDPLTKVYVAFQGGGARGVAHIGALRALESTLVEAVEKLKLQSTPTIFGYAGTSAGAIVAALAACGYEADHLFDRTETSTRHLLNDEDIGAPSDLTALFGSGGWRKIRQLLWMGHLIRAAGWVYRTVMGWPLRKRLTRGIIAVATVSASLFITTHTIDRLSAAHIWTIRVNSYGLIAAIVAVILLAVLLYLQFRPGLTDVETVRKVLSAALRNGKRPGLPRDRDLTFKDLSDSKALPLYIIATNLTKQSIQVFSARSTPHVKIVDAVCASICLPYIFKSYEIEIEGETMKFVDGGVLSNLPLWTFDEERARDAECWTIGFSLKDPKVDADAH